MKTIFRSAFGKAKTISQFPPKWMYLGENLIVLEVLYTDF